MNTNYVPEVVPTVQLQSSMRHSPSSQGTHASRELMSYEINGGNIVRITTEQNGMETTSYPKSTRYFVTDFGLAEQDLLSGLGLAL